MGTEATGPPYYLWEAPGKPISIQLHFDVIDRILPEVLRGFGALPRRGAEVGGILLGRCDQDPQVVRVVDFEPIPCEYKTGPSYNLSERDLRSLEEALKRWDGKNLSVVGFFRSHTRKDLFLDDADAALLTRYFPDPSQVTLLIKPFATRTSLAGFFFWEDGEIQRQASYLEFPFHRRELGGGEPRPLPVIPDDPPEPRPRPAPRLQVERSPAERQTPLRQSVEAALEQAVERKPLERLPVEKAPEKFPANRPPERAATLEPAAEPARPQPAPLVASGVRGSLFNLLTEPPPPPPKTQWKKWVWAPVAIAVAIVGGAMGFRASKESTVQPPQSETVLPLQLSVSEAESHLDVTWNRSAPAIQGAKRGLLTIQDGGNRRDLELSPTQLQTGRVMYSRLTGDVNLKLEVFSDQSGSVSESVRIVSAQPIPPPPVAQAPPPAVPKPAPPPIERTASPPPAKKERIPEVVVVKPPRQVQQPATKSVVSTSKRQATPTDEEPKPQAATPPPVAPEKPETREVPRPGRRR